MHSCTPTGEPLDHRPAGEIGKGRKRCVELIHNQMVAFLGECGDEIVVVVVPKNLV